MTVNKENISMREGESFLSLIKKTKILIPNIQRDYAQGRLDPRATEIRDNFLTSIFDALTTKNSDPLLLDFIYGSTDNNIFTPLDGQQRLTTLFLLHWYFIPESKKSPLLRDHGNSRYSLFSYETRISSKDFCNELVTHSAKELKKDLDKYKVGLQKQIDEAECKLNELSDLERKRNITFQISNLKNKKSLANLSTIIKDQSWFLWSWRKDPTVKAMLVMLDEIDDRAEKIGEATHDEIWEQLEKGKIQFHLLPLEQFALTDDLYVKMNARGKELSQFDIFKSTLEEQMRLNEVDEEIQNKWKENVDSNWIDIFWNKKAKPHLLYETNKDDDIVYVNSVEESYLRFFKRMMEFHLFMNEHCIILNLKDEAITKYIPFEANEDTFLGNIRDYSVRNDILRLLPLLNRTRFFKEDFFKFIIDFFESFIYQSDNEKHEGTELIEGVSFENGKNLFESFVDEKIDYETRVQFFAILKFFQFYSAREVCNDEKLKYELNSWMRIIRNLSTNSNTNFYNGYDDFMKSLKSIDAWATTIYSNEGTGNINDYIKDQHALDGFNSEQLMEEQTKARLMSENYWKDTIREAEEHPYFLGQIRFLLEWSKVNDKYDITLFNKYKAQCSSVFDKDGLQSELSKDHLFRNALLKNSEYLLNDSFIYNTTKDRAWSWKRYLRETDMAKNIKKLIDFYNDKNISFKDFCVEHIKSLPNDWRKYFIEIPNIYDSLKEHKINYWNRDTEEICLLSKKTWGSNHKELKTYYLYLKYGKNDDSYLDSTDANHPFTANLKTIDNKKFSVRFIPRKNEKNEWIEGEYIISTNDDFGIATMQRTGMQSGETNSKWKRTLCSSQFENVEKIIETLNSFKE